MLSRKLDIGARLAAIVIGVGVAFSYWDDQARDFETSVIVAAIRPFSGNSKFIRLEGPQILIAGPRSFPFIGTITPSCSALGAVLAFAAVSSLVLQGVALRRALGFAAAALLCFCANVIRISLALIIGAHDGRHSMVTFHDWFGTPFGLLALFGGFVVLLRVMLPSLAQLLDAQLAGFEPEARSKGRSEPR